MALTYFKTCHCKLLFNGSNMPFRLGLAEASSVEPGVFN